MFVVYLTTSILTVSTIITLDINLNNSSSPKPFSVRFKVNTIEFPAYNKKPLAPKPVASKPKVPSVVAVFPPREFAVGYLNPVLVAAEPSVLISENKENHEIESDMAETKLTDLLPTHVPAFCVVNATTSISVMLSNEVFL